jgi:hypothetical protein
MAALWMDSRTSRTRHEWLVVSSLLIFFHVPGSYVTQGEPCLYVILFVERDHGVIIFDCSGDL